MPQRKHSLTIADLWSLKRFGAPTISPDGATACAALTGFDMDSNESRTDLWLFPTNGKAGRRLTAGDKDGDPKWSPDGRWIAFTAKRKDDEEAQIYIIAADGGEAQRLTKLPTGASALRWFPDSQAHRLRIVGLARARRRKGAGQANEGAQGVEGQGARHRAQ